MKKTLAVALLVVMLVIVGVSSVYATSSSTLADELYSIGKKYGMTSADKVKIQRYFADNATTDEKASAIVAEAKKAAAVMDEAGVTDYSKLTEAQKSEVKSIAQKAASVVDLSLKFDTNSISVYNSDGKLVETISNSNGKLAYTGNSVNMTVVVSSIAVVALAAVVAKKRLSYEK